MKNLLIAAALLGLVLSGCAVLGKPGSMGSSKSGLKSSQDCEQNQHWDGEMCRHNGKGHGARKHDG